MKVLLCYFSCSGNTLLGCKYVAAKVKNAELVLFDMVKDGAPDLARWDVVGFACFADFFGPSQLVLDFVANLPQQNGKPAFVFNTYGALSGKTLRILDKKVTAKGFKVIAGHSLHTPESYPPMAAGVRGGKEAPNEREMATFNHFIAELDNSLSRIREGREVPKVKPRIGFLNSIFPAFSRTKARRDMGPKYVDEKLCTECGTCAEVCPYDAIELNPKPTFDMKRCYGCWSCYNHCPEKAIYTGLYRGIGHYPKPYEQMETKLKV